MKNRHASTDANAPSFNVGDRVRAKEAIYEPADDHAPGGYLCMKGDLLIVRKLTPQFKRSLSVSHESETERSFGVEPGEVEADGVRLDVAPCADTVAGCAPDCDPENRCRAPGVAPSAQPQQENPDAHR